MPEDYSFPPETLATSYRGEHTAERGYDTYVQDLGVELQPGDRVLDVGAATGTFAGEVWQRSNGTITVDSLDTFTGEDVVAGRVTFVRNSLDQANIQYWPHNRIVGDITRGVAAPDNFYNHVVSHSAVPVWIEDADQQKAPERMAAAIHEMLRVCKDGGDVRMFPMTVDNHGLLSGFEHPGFLLHMQAVLEKHGHTLRLEEVYGAANETVSPEYRIVIEKRGDDVPTADELMRFSLVTRLVAALKEAEINLKAELNSLKD